MKSERVAKKLTLLGLKLVLIIYKNSVITSQKQVGFHLQRPLFLSVDSIFSVNNWRSVNTPCG
jgi:hypothetical protein